MLNRKNILLTLLSSIFALFLVLFGFSIKPINAKADTNVIDSMSISLTEGIDIKYYIDKSIGENGYLVCEMGGVEKTITKYVDDGTHYIFTYEEVAPQFIAETITATAYNAGAESLGTKAKSVRDYCDGLLSSTASELGCNESKYASLQTLLVDLLNYGTKTQEYVATQKEEIVEDSNKANSILSKYSLSGGSYTLPVESNRTATLVGSNETKGYAYPKTVTIELDNKVKVVYKYFIKESSYTFELRQGENKVTGWTITTAETTNGYIATITYSLSASELDDEMYIEVKNGDDTVGYATTFTLADYVFEKQDDENIGNLVKALYAYSKSANAFSVYKANQTAIDLVLFVGQSNMVGRETEQYTVDIADNKALEYRYNENSLVEIANPVGENIYVDETKVVEVSSGSSIVPKFCETYVNETGRTIVAVHIAKGGERITSFKQGTDIYNVIVEKFGGAVEYLNDSTDYYINTKFYVMYQGESDTNSTEKSAYKTNYLDFHNGLKDEFGFEFGALIYTGSDLNYENVVGIDLISQAKKELAEENDDIIVCDKEPEVYYCDDIYATYIRDDKCHLSGAGLQKVGVDSCTNILNYMGLGEDTALEGVDPVTYLAEVGVYNVTLDNDDLKFIGEESTVRVKAIKAGKSLTDVIETISGNEILAFVAGDDIITTMGRSAITVDFISGSFVLSGEGQVNLGVGLDANAGNWTSVYSGKVTRGNYAYFDNTKGMLGRVFNITGNYQATTSEGTGTNANFRFLTTYNKVSNYTYTFYFKNMSEQTFDANLYLRSSGSDTSAIVYTAHIYAEAGETIQVKLPNTNVSGGNALLTYFKLNSNISNANILMACFATSGITSNVTLTGGATFEDESTSKDIAYNGTVPTIVCDGALGYRDQDNNFYFPTDTIKVGLYDITLTPIFDTVVTESSGMLKFGYAYNDVNSLTKYDSSDGSNISRLGYVYIDDLLMRKYSITAKAGDTTETTETNATFRVMTNYNRIKGVNYTVTYTVKNFSTFAVNFKLYARESGTDTSTPDYRQVSLGAGESTEIVMDVANNTGNNNWLTYFKVDEDMTNAIIGVGATISIETTQITLVGGTFSDDSTTKALDQGTTLPEITLIGEYEGKTVVGVKDGDTAYYISDYRVGTTATTLTVIAKQDTVTSGVGKWDFGQAVVTDGIGSGVNKYIADVNDLGHTLIGEEYSAKYSFTATAGQSSGDGTSTGAMFRIMTNYNRSQGVTYVITYTIKNIGSVNLDFEIYNRESGSDKTAIAEDDIARVTLSPNEVGTYTLTNVNSTGNNNYLTYFRNLLDTTDGRFAIYAYISYPTKTVTLQNGLEFSDGSTVKAIIPGQAIPEITYTGSGTLVGYNLDMNGTQSYKTSLGNMGEFDTTIIPVLDAECVTSGAGKISYYTNTTPTSWNGVSKHTTEKYGYDGVVGAKMSFTTSAGGQARLMTPYAANNTARTARYHIVNIGTVAMSFTAYQVNSSNTTTNAPSKAITLAVGEDIWFDLQFTYSNQNIMILCQFDEAYTSQALFIDCYMYVGTCYDLTLTNGLKFSDSSTTSLIARGSSVTIDTTDVVAPEGYVVAGVVNSDNPAEYWAIDAFTMPSKAITVEPYFEVSSFVAKSTTKGEGGKVDLIGRNTMFRTPTDATGTKLGISNPTVGVLKNSDGFYEKAALYTSSAMTEGGTYYFEPMVGIGEGSNTYTGSNTAVYTIYNMNTCDVTVQIWQTGSGNTPKTSGTASEKVTIKAGEVGTVTVTFNINNNNFMPYFEFTDVGTTTSFNVAVTCYIAHN